MNDTVVAKRFEPLIAALPEPLQPLARALVFAFQRGDLDNDANMSEIARKLELTPEGAQFTLDFANLTLEM